MNPRESKICLDSFGQGEKTCLRRYWVRFFTVTIFRTGIQRAGFRSVLALMVILGSVENGAGCCCTRALAALTDGDASRDSCCSHPAATKSSCCPVPDRGSGKTERCALPPARGTTGPAAKCCECCHPDGPLTPRIPPTQTTDSSRLKARFSPPSTHFVPLIDNPLPAVVISTAPDVLKRKLCTHNRAQSLLCVWRN